MIKNFAVFKNTKKENEKQPDYNMSVKVGEAYVNVGGGWIKEGKTGKFISFKLSDAFGDRKGFSITEDKEQPKDNQPSFDKDSKGKEILPDNIDF